MFSALLILLAAAPRPCVAFTTLCGPAGSTLEGEVQPGYGGTVTLTSPTPPRLLGATFVAAQPISIHVTPWSSSDGTRGAVVQVDGTLQEPRQIQGVLLEGRVSLMQRQGPGKHEGPVVLGNAISKAPSRFTPEAFGPVELPVDARITGSVEATGTRTWVTAPAPMSVEGLALAAGTLNLYASDSSRSLEATLEGPHRIAGVQVQGFVQVVWPSDGGVELREGQLVEAAALEPFIGVEGTLPAGAVFSRNPAELLVTTTKPVEVAGIQLTGPIAFPGQPRVLRFVPDRPGVTVFGELGPAGAKVDGLVFGGAIALHHVRGRSIGFVEGALRQTATRLGATFAAQKTFSASITGEPTYVRGTLTAPQRVGDLWATGEVLMQRGGAGIEVQQGTVARPFEFEGWKLPGGTQLQRGGTLWHFVAPPGQSAQRVARDADLPELVRDGTRDESSQSFTLAKPWSSVAAGLTFKTWVRRTSDGCLEGDAVGTVAPFTFAAEGFVTWCDGRIVAVKGNHAAPVLRVGAWFATDAIEGEPEDKLLATPERVKRRTTPGTGFWIQVRSLCQGAAGIPLPPPEQQWIFVDARGQPTNAAARAVLEKIAARPGSPCVAVPCCVP